MLNKIKLLNSFRSSAGQKFHIPMKYSDNGVYEMFGHYNYGIMADRTKKKLMRRNTSRTNGFISSNKNSLKKKSIRRIEQRDRNNTSKETISDLLLVHYVSAIVMLEARNYYWPYDYMDFARRVGELWEPFCDVPLKHPLKSNIGTYKPMSFKHIQQSRKLVAFTFINSLDLDSNDKETLKEIYDNNIKILDTQSTQMKLDLHLKQKTSNNKFIYYDIDYKSGFSSNEKGNANRELLVAGIFKSLKDKHIPMLLVRQDATKNNDYFNKLVHSGFWTAYCGKKSYSEIYKLSGFDIQSWVNKNMNWTRDISPDFYSHLKRHDLLQYLEW